MQSRSIITSKEIHIRKGGNFGDFGKNESHKETEQNSEQIKKTDTKQLLLSIFDKNKKDSHIEVPHLNGLGALASRAKLVNRGGVGETQSYSTLKNNLIRSKTLYEDPDFPASSESIYFTSTRGHNFEWKRPHEICQNPEFISGDASRFDVCQGELGDCWLLAAVSSLSMQKMLFKQVVSEDQSFELNKDYCGAFHFHFWHFGQWKEIIIDDRLPTRNNQLVFMHSAENNEFWSALLEKAYAKLYGCYELLKGGSSIEAMEDFTGGISELLDIKTDYRVDLAHSEKLFSIMLESQSRLSMMGASIEADPRHPEAKLSCGLVMGHAYSITAIRQIEARVPGYKSPIKLVRLRNPWGTVEWKGEWSDSSATWKYITDRMRGQLGLNFDNDGEFWMSFDDFVKNFEKVEICHLGPQSLGESLLSSRNKRKWEATIQSGQWKKGITAGGCLNYPNTFWTNPQFRITIEDPDPDDKENMGTVIIGLMQKNTRSIRNRSNDLPAVGYVIYQVDQNLKGHLDRNFFRLNRKVAMSPAFINLREVCGRHKLMPGSYVIIPSTFDPHDEGEFLLRLFSEKQVIGNEIDEQSGVIDVDNMSSGSITTGSDDTADGRASHKKSINPDERLRLEQAFKQIAGSDMEVDSERLSAILNAVFRRESFFKEFTKDTCRSLVAMLDSDLSGRLGFSEFLELWKDIRLWKSVFKRHDADGSGTLNSYELRNLLNEIGFRISNRLFSSLVTRFSNSDNTVAFDDFIHCCVRLKSIFLTFKAQRKNSSNEAIFDQDTFIQSAIYS